jgi:hypothetical protein
MFLNLVGVSRSFIATLIYYGVIASFMCLKFQASIGFFYNGTGFWQRISGIKKGLDNLSKPLFFMVPRAGVEPARPYSRGILSPLRLPISPPRHL